MCVWQRLRNMPILTLGYKRAGLGANISGQGDRLDADQLTARRQEALWKWRWLGWRDSTPAFKASLLLLAAVLFALIAYASVIGR
jgi:hypothetical protein